ncbi:MAG: hypothetical protein LBB25_01995 [Holosporaceae bacterium]|nr:hypothetical protein [Holosporaceae bacterium]
MKMKNKNDSVMLGIDDKNLRFEISQKENIVRKEGFWKKLLNNTIKRSLLVSALMFGYAQGDVLRDPAPVAVVNNAVPAPGAAAPGGSFAAYVNANIGVLPGAPAFVGGIDWQMKGYAVFVPAAGAPGRVYVAQKRRFAGGVVANNNPAAGGNVLNYTNDMHTERQLAIAALTEAVVALAPAVGGAFINIPAVPGAGVLGAAAGLAGTLHIYTEHPPCRNPVLDNGNFSCIAYYNALGAMFPGVTFHIYFSAANMTLNNWYMTNTPAAKIALFNEIDAAMAGGGVLGGHFRIRSVLQYTHNGVWHTTDSDGAPGVAAGAGAWGALITQPPLSAAVNAILANAPAAATFTIAQREHMFNAVHVHPANVFYHAI